MEISADPTSPRMKGEELFHQHIKESQYEREDVQKKTFGKWINSQLAKINSSPVTDLFYDLRDGTRLLSLLTVLTGKNYKPEKGCMRVHHLNNVNTAFRVLDKHNVKLVNISNNDIVDGNPKLTLGLVWSIILHWQVQDVLKGSMTELQQSGLEKTLLAWCREATKGYADVNINNFTTSWSDGLAFIALIHRFRPDILDYEIASRKSSNARLDYAFRIANKTLGIARLLDPEDVNTETPDKKSVMMYVMCLYQALPHSSLPINKSSLSNVSEASVDSSDSTSENNRPLSTVTADSVDFSAYQTLMEEVLVWLLAAEDHLDSASPVETELTNVKEQFHKHEEFLLQLTSQQGSVGAVLQEGNQLLQDGKLSSEEEEEIRIQMRLLNSRWEQLRSKAMNRQTRIHEVLMKLQQEQLDRLRQWLTATEDRISQLGIVQHPSNLAAVLQMYEEHQTLQRDLEAQQDNVNGLSNMVVVVDEAANDLNCSQMEDQLIALGERWSHVCQWAELRGSALQHLVNHWQQLDHDLLRLKNWLAAHEHSLKLIEANPSADKNQMMETARQLQLLERDMEPHHQRLNQLQENAQRLPLLIQAAISSEQSTKKLNSGTFKCVERLLQDMEHLEDRMEALKEIMEAQRQRMSKTDVNWKMVVLPPDITTSLTMFDEIDVIRQPKAVEMISSDVISNFDNAIPEEVMSNKKRKLNSHHQTQYEEAVQQLKQHLENMEQLIMDNFELRTLEVKHQEHKPDLDQVLKTGHALIENMGNDISEICKIEDDMTSLTERWLVVEESLKQKEFEQEKIVLMKEGKNIEEQIDSVLTAEVAITPNTESNNKSMELFRTLSHKWDDQVLLLSKLLLEEDESLQVFVDTLKMKVEKLQAKADDFDEGLLVLRQMRDEERSLNKWMSEVRNFLTAEEVAWGDVDTLEAQLEQSNALQEDVKTLEPSVVNINQVLTLLVNKIDDNLRQELENTIEVLNNNWKQIISDAKEKNDNLKKALELTRKTTEGMKNLYHVLKELEVDIPPVVAINSTSDLSQALRKLSSLKNRIDVKADYYQDIVDAGFIVVNNSNTPQEFKEQFSTLNKQWAELTTTIFERQRSLKDASHHYGGFKVLTAQECDWQDKLEKKLLRSTAMAADAEEISEELDDLENFMKNRPKSRLERIKSMGNELLSLSIMADSVGQEVQTLTERWNNLSTKAKEKAEWLENRVRGAQQCEQRLVQLHSAINSIDTELVANLEQDLYGDELPDLCQRIARDISQQEALLAEIRHEGQDYEAEGRKEAANRLREQLSLIELCLQDVKVKFRKFQNPSELEPRLERMLRVLRDLEQGMCYIELASDDSEAIEGQLNNCIRFYTSLSDIKGEVEAVLRIGRQSVEDGLVDDPITISAQLDAMKALYNRLGEQVAVARETLERALQLSIQLSSDMGNLGDWLNHLEAEIHKKEGEFADKPNLTEEALFYEKCLEDLQSKQLQRDAIHENYDYFTALCDVTLLESLRERVEDLNQEWDRIENRLKGTISNDEKKDVELVKKDPCDLGNLIPKEDSLGYLNAAFEDFDEHEKEAKEVLPCPTLEVVRGDVGLVDDSGSFSGSSTSSSTSSDESDADSVKQLKVEVSSQPVVVQIAQHTTEESEQLAMPDDNEKEQNQSSSVELHVVEVKASEILQHRHVEIETHSTQLPVAELPSMEIVNSRPLTPEVSSATTFCEVLVDDVNIERTDSMNGNVIINNGSSNDISLTKDPESKIMSADILEQVLMKQLGIEMVPRVAGECVSNSPKTFTPPPTPATDQISPFTVIVAPQQPLFITREDPFINENVNTISDQNASPKVELVLLPESASTINESSSDSQAMKATHENNQHDSAGVSHALAATNDIVQTNTGEQSFDPTVCFMSRHDDFDPDDRQSPKADCQLEYSRKISRDEGTQTDMCGIIGHAHQITELLHVTKDKVELQVHSAIEEGIPTDQCLEPMTTNVTKLEVAGTSKQTSEKTSLSETTNLDPILSPSSDGEVFTSDAEILNRTNDDEDSFYGSDKEVDEAVEFSHTDSSSSSSSSSESETDNDKQETEQLDVQENRRIQLPPIDNDPLAKEVSDFEEEVSAMLNRINDVSSKLQPSSPEFENEEMELSLLDPDIATLISRGDSLVLRVQTSDLDRALGINATTGKLRTARVALKAGSEVRRQRIAEQEEMLKACQQQTEQLQRWLTDIAQTLDHITRVNDHSQLQVIEEELNRRQNDIRQLTEATSKLQEQQVQEYQTLIRTLTIRWQELQRQFQEFQKKDSNMVGPDFVTRVNKLREAISSVSRQLHSPPLNLKHYEQLSGQEDTLKSIKSALYTLKGNVDVLNQEKDDALNAASTAEQKEQILRVLDKLRDEWTLLNRAFADKQNRVHQSVTTWRAVQTDMKDFEDWLNKAESALTGIQGDEFNRTERKEKLKQLESQVTARHKVMSNITSTCREVWLECSTADAVLLREKQEVLSKRWRTLLSGLAAVRQRLTSLDGSPAQVAKLSAVITTTPKKEESRSLESEYSTPKETPPSTPSAIVASLDKSILQIRDWLTVLETMLKQQVAIVGDSEDVVQLLEKQKNVLRELEQKKPQLDELVQTAENIKDSTPSGKQQLPTQVSQLREHWEETASAVTARKNQLEILVADSQQFERRRHDVDQWLGRMESRLSRLAPVAATADLLDVQHREQKILQNEIQQYKGQIDNLDQLTQRLVSSYPHDDTTRVSRTNDNIGQRYSALNAGVNTRGRALNAALGSLHSFDRSLDKFMAWLSDAESSLESLELELDSYGPGVKTSRDKVLRQLKELSVELEGRRDEQSGLANSGQRLVSTLESSQSHPQGQSGNDDALMLRRRLDDMNRRWHGLRAKTVAIRNRLENNTEHWNALLLSLRELIEWVIRKDTELTGLGPIRGDLSTLIKQQDDFRAFRRQLDDKRPLIEQSILTGRQLATNEPPLSDVSDSEAGRDLPGDSRGYRSAEEAARELTSSIRREGTKLAERWAALRDRTERWSVELDTTTNRVRQLQTNMDDASNRLIPAETIRSQWTNPAEYSPQQIQQHLEQLKELSDSLTPVQLMIEEVNDQAARLADSGVPLSHSNLSRLDDLNSRWKVLQSSLDDRYQQLCGATRDGVQGGPGLQNFLASSVDHPWERSVTEADVPYYINHQTETTHWDHPRMDELMNSLSEFNDVRFSAYRTAQKLRQVQKFLRLDKLKLATAIETFDAHGLRAQNDKVIDVADMITVLRSLYESITAVPSANITLALGVDLCLNWILNVYDSQRSGEIRVLSFKVIITLLCRSHLEEKYRYLFRLIADPNRLVDAPKLGVLLHDCVQMPRELGEVASFGGSNIEPSVKSCFEKAGKQRQTIEAVHFLAWMKQEPQSVVWLPVLHRLAASENARHQSKCNVCKANPIVGLRYRCLKCLSFDMCQKCFFTGKISKSHKLTHPMQEYCTATTSGEDIKDFTRTLRNKFKSKRYFKKHPRLGYLPVQTALEGTVTPSDFQSEASSIANTPQFQDSVVPSNVTSMDETNKDFTPDSEDEHQLIAQYCRSLNGDMTGTTSSNTPRSPVQLLAALDANHKEEIETMIRELEEENATLQAEYERLRSQQSPSLSLSLSSSPDELNVIPQGAAGVSDAERDMLAEARLLRQHKTRLETRMKILEEHNRQLEAQLGRLRQLLDEPGTLSSPVKTGTLQSRPVTAAHLATDIPSRSNGVGHEGHSWAENNGVERLESRPPPPPLMAPSPAVNAQNVGNLLHMAGDLGKVVGSLVTVMTDAGDHSPPLTDEEN